MKDNSIFVIRGPNSTNIGNKKIYCQCPLRENVLSILERNMQTAHFEIVQLAVNMNKLAGMLIFSEQSLIC